MNKQKIKIDIVSDVNCPWCYVGEQRLKKAIAATQDKYEVEINFKPYELNAGIPQEGVNRVEYFKNAYGPSIVSQLDAMNQRMTDAGSEEGITFNFDKQNSVNNTFNAHRLIWLAAQHGVQQQVVNALFYSNFTEGNNMNDTAVLKAVGLANGIPAQELDGFFESEAGKAEVRELEQWAHASGITGVPAFIINDQYLVSGAQPAETFQNVFAQVAPKLQEIKTEGDSCSIDGNC
ncbi:putative DsbA family dithiol-disulfide isomerase [Pontibacter ummariensis]|uniref:Predicted dithiol-disulfide isomerase, DsbA family n=1 Tax=Pontibacter ummariensis TaxID=1610492 RepID=A0A239GPF7_9BACT|nr:DsbA family oxidoreductase [Pontibacter ummariensis]PRY11346.1 putative DsbA family dithiol-disulfide isomerase [Pontibacter ummariensis]SNS70383.1 Predicted dithiol-disulfide isomerase, DsbA family [Pontibacter ummariensis]